MNAFKPGAAQSDLEWLFARQRFGVDLGLIRVEELLGRLGRPQDAFETVLVGGTNGKGSTAATLASILNAAGRRTALFTSPHLTRFAERFVVAGEEVTEGVLSVALAAVRPHAEAVGATFFEIVTALGCLLFARAGAEVAVMEVGLGGRLDATNALEPTMSVITNIALDHTDVLGGTEAAIAAEKAGILRANVPALTGATGEALGVIKAVAEKLKTPLWVLGEDITLTAADLGWSGVRVDVQTPVGTLELTTPLLGLHQARNVALAAAAAQRLGVPDDAIRQGVAATRWPGRLEPLPYRGRTVLLDGAHNPQAAHALAAAFVALNAAPVTLLFGAAVDKDLAAIAEALAPVTAHAVLTRAELSPRAASPEALALLWPLPTTLAETPGGALEHALALTPSGGVIVVCGSLYLVGEVRPLLLDRNTEAWERLQ